MNTTPQETQEPERFLIDVREAARRLSVSIRTVYEWANKRGLPISKIGGRSLIHVEKLKAWIDSQISTPEKEKGGGT